MFYFIFFYIYIWIFFLFKWNFVEKRNKTKKNSFVQFISMDSLLLVTNKWQTSKSKMFLNHSVFFVCFPFVCLSFFFCFRVKYHYHRHHITINFITHAKWIQYEFSMKNFCLLFFFSVVVDNHDDDDDNDGPGNTMTIINIFFWLSWAFAVCLLLF